jgi:hypothetical protein
VQRWEHMPSRSRFQRRFSTHQLRLERMQLHLQFPIPSWTLQLGLVLMLNRSRFLIPS